MADAAEAADAACNHDATEVTASSEAASSEAAATEAAATPAENNAVAAAEVCVQDYGL